MNKELPTGYYLDNFILVMEFVIAHYSDLLNEKELEFYKTFKTLSLSAQRLYVRLISRKGPIFRSDKLQYEEIPNISSAAQDLAEARFLTINPEINIEQLAGLLTKPELYRDFEHVLASVKNEIKPKQVDVLLDYFDIAPMPLSGFLPVPSFDLYLPLSLDIIVVFRLLFFGNLRQNLSEFVLLDLGLYRYENYAFDPKERLFNDRITLDQYLSLADLTEICIEAQQKEKLDQLHHAAAYLSNLSTRPGLEQKRSGLINFIARELERRQKLEKALELFEQSYVSPARERRVRILVKLGREKQALKLCRQILDEPLDEEELEFAQRFAVKLGVKTTPVFTTPELKMTELSLPRSEMKVELAALNYYTKCGYETYYVENSLMLGLFGLAFWDIIFMPATGAFFNKYQRGPKGLFTPEFRKQRERVINKRLEDISIHENWTEYMLDVFHNKHGINNYLVNWFVFSEDLLRSACELIPKEHVITIFDRLSFDLRNNRSGFPDLILFHKEKMEYLWVEIKGPGDRLQNNQKRWLTVFEKANIPYQIAHVRWQ